MALSDEIEEEREVRECRGEVDLRVLGIRDGAVEVEEQSDDDLLPPIGRGSECRLDAVEVFPEIVD